MSSETMMVEQSDERDALRARLAGMWGAVAGGWAQHADYADARGAQSAERMLDAGRGGHRRPCPRARLRTGRARARGRRARRARRRGRPHRRRRADDRDRRRARRRAGPGQRRLPPPRARATSTSPTPPTTSCCAARASCSPSSPARAVAEIRRVLRPGGRVAIAVWAARERNPWLGLVMDVVSAQTGAPVPPPGIPGPFALGDAGELRRLLDEAGLTDVQVGELSVPLRTASFDEWWARTSALAGPLSAILAVDCPRRPCRPARARERSRAPLRERVGRARLPGRGADRGRPARVARCGGAAVRRPPSARRAATPRRPRAPWPGGRRCASPGGAR